MEVGGQRRRPRDAESQLPESLDAGGVNQPGVHRRHTEEQGGVAGGRRQHVLNGEGALQNRRRAGEQGAVQPDAESVHVEEREAEDQAVVGLPPPGDAQRLGAGEQVAV